MALVTVLVLVVGGTAAWVTVHRLSANLRTAPLNAGTAGAGVEKVDPFGHSPINILLIGSDARTNKADCRLGGGCRNGRPSGARADVEMIVHVSADRTNATVLSIPRDLITELPACHDTATGASAGVRRGMINSALSYGPGCSVAAVHHLTGIPIDHFAMVDFAGVVTMSDAVGGARVCVSANVYDRYSHLKLAKGAHTLKGVAALKFVRSRHGFGDGGDLSRTYTQHVFLSAVIRSLERRSVLTDPATVLTLAGAVTRAMTVDTGLGSVTSLAGLAGDLAKVPSSRITFVTMQTLQDPTSRGRVLLGPGATQLFATIADDQSLSQDTSGESSSPSATSSGAPTPTPTPSVAGLVVRVQNASGRAGRAGVVARSLVARGLDPATSASTAPALQSTTRVRYGPQDAAGAQALVDLLGLPASALEPVSAAGLTLRIGTDWTTGTSWHRSTVLSRAEATAAVARAHAQTADESSSCAQVSRVGTQKIDEVWRTPTQVYALFPDVPNTAP